MKKNPTKIEPVDGAERPEKTPTEYADEVGKSYIRSQSREDRKSAGQYFTPTELASRMAALINATAEQTFSIMDPAAGVGTLLCAAVEKIIYERPEIYEITIYAYEKDKRIIPLLTDVLQNLCAWAEKENNVHIRIEIIRQDFLEAYAHFVLRDQKDLLYSRMKHPIVDAVISNPPYQKLTRKTRPTCCTSSMTQGYGNIYALFMYISSFLVRDGKSIIFLTPRSFASGQNFANFRTNFYRKMTVTNIILLGSRTSAFARDNVLQEIMILKAARAVPDNVNQRHISILYVDSKKSNCESQIQVRYDVAWAVQQQGVRLQIPKSDADLRVLQGLNKHANTLESLGFRVRTGEVVPFRCRDMLRYKNDHHNVPLIWMSDVCATKGSIQKRRVQPRFIYSGAKEVITLTHNIALVRRFSAGDCGIKVMAEPLIKQPGSTSAVGIENHVNYILHPRYPNDCALIRGLVKYLNSSPVQAFFNCMCGTTQVSAHDLKALPVPSLEGLRGFGLDESSAEEFIGLVENDSDYHTRCAEKAVT